MSDDLNEENLLRAAEEIANAKQQSGVKIHAVPTHINRLMTKEEVAQSLFDTAKTMVKLEPAKQQGVALLFARALGGDELYRRVNDKFFEELSRKIVESQPVAPKYEYTHDGCPYKDQHEVFVDWAKTSPYVLPDHIVSDGGCADGCCDDFRCKACGYWFRIECPQ